ncbi:hypothetical protein [Mycobacterium sp. M26]|uniref:hypothetical protein n=1 Tax=Mycobacterium sp. M26 TaxID=1762962 RepID=UPI00073E8CB6|nr:hypothetical protein [Mycobacterium sp. M26]
MNPGHSGFTLGEAAVELYPWLDGLGTPAAPAAAAGPASNSEQAVNVPQIPATVVVRLILMFMPSAQPY